MDIEELHAVQSRERSSSDLQELRDSFYADVAQYLETLREERNRLATEREDPYDDAVIRVNDKIQTAERVVESIYERRVGKVVDRAAFAATGVGEDNLEGLTEEERSLFKAIVERIESNRSQVLDEVTGDSEGTPPGVRGDVDAVPAESDDEPDETDDGPVEVPAGGMTDGGPVRSQSGHSMTAETNSNTSQPSPAAETTAETTESGPPADSSAESLLDDRQLVRITDEVGEILGVDERIYDLQPNDVVLLPAPNAAPLLERGAADRLD